MNRKLTMRQIQRAARFLQAREELSGAGLRALLYRRHGARGSVERIYEVVRELTGRRPRPYARRASVIAVNRAARVDAVPAPSVPHASSVEEGAPVESQLESIVQERDAALARAALSEARYESDTARWMREVDQLRLRLGQEGRPAYLIYGRDPRDVVRELESRLADMQRRVLALESAHRRD